MISSALKTPSKVGFKDLSEDEIKEYVRILKSYMRELKKCKDAKAYIGGCVLAGAALEATLLLMVSLYIDDVKAHQLHSRKIKKLMGKNTERWGLADYLITAKEMGWLPYSLNIGQDEYERDQWDNKKVKIGDFAEVIRMLRNCIHPTAWVKENPGKRITSRYLNLVSEVIYITQHDYLYKKLSEDIIEELKASGEW